MKRLIALVLSILMVSSVFVGCGKQNTEKASNDSGAKEKTSKQESKDIKSKDQKMVTPAGTLPIANEKIKLKALTPENVFVKDFETNWFTKYIEEQTNIDIDFEIAPKKSSQEKINLVLASGDYPDVFINAAISPSTQMNYGNQGIFVPINDMIKEYGTAFKEFLAKKPEVKDIITLPGGNIYDVPQINDCYHCKMSSKMYIYKPWLDKLGLEIPETTEEFYQALKAFKEKDPNGNGEADEIPFAGALDGWNTRVVTFLMNSFIYTDWQRLQVIDGKIDPIFNKDEWKEGIKYFKKLYDEDLLYHESFTQDLNQLKQISTQDPNILGAAPGGFPGIFTTEISETDTRFSDFVAVPALEGPQGFRSVELIPVGMRQGQYIITNACEYPEVAFRLADWMYNEDITTMAIWGPENEGWRKGKDGERGINGEPAKIVSLTEFEKGAQNLHWAQTGPTLRSSEWRLSNVADWEARYDGGIALYKETKERMEPYAPPVKKVVPKLVFNDEQSEELPDIKKTIGDYVDEMFTRFVTGDADIDAEWDNYLKELENMNLKRYIEIYQEAYDAKMK